VAGPSAPAGQQRIAGVLPGFVCGLVTAGTIHPLPFCGDRRAGRTAGEGQLPGCPSLRHNWLRRSAKPRFEVAAFDLNDAVKLHVLEFSAIARCVYDGPRGLQQFRDLADGEEAVVWNAADKRLWDQGLRQSGVSRQLPLRKGRAAREIPQG